MPQPQYAQVIGSIPGPMRLEVSCTCRIPEGMQRTAATLNARPEVGDIRASVQTGGILVTYDRERGGLNLLRVRLVGIAVILTENPSAQVPSSSGGRIQAAVTFLNGMRARGKEPDGLSSYAASGQRWLR